MRWKRIERIIATLILVFTIVGGSFAAFFGESIGLVNQPSDESVECFDLYTRC